MSLPPTTLEVAHIAMTNISVCTVAAVLVVAAALLRPRAAPCIPDALYQHMDAEAKYQLVLQKLSTSTSSARWIPAWRGMGLLDLFWQPMNTTFDCAMDELPAGNYAYACMPPSLRNQGLMDLLACTEQGVPK